MILKNLTMAQFASAQYYLRDEPIETQAPFVYDTRPIDGILALVT